jgi:AcrR family transcriptional regulator
MAARRSKRPAPKKPVAAASTRARAPVQSRDPARRTRILDVAKRHFVRLGFKGTNLDAVARDAGCAKGALYLEFPDKRALILEVIMRSYRDTKARYDREVAAIASPVERIIASLRFSYVETAREPLFARLLHEDPDVLSLLPSELLDEAKVQVKEFDVWVADAKQRGEIRADVDTAALPYVMSVLKYAPAHLDLVEQLGLFSKPRALDAVLDILRAGLTANTAPPSPRRSR